MLEEDARADLEERQWVCTTKDINLIPQEGAFVSLWKHYAIGIAITLSIYYKDSQFVLYEDVGHMAGTNRANRGTFSTANDAVHELIEACYSWDNTWGM